VLHRSPVVLGLLQSAFGTGLVGMSLLVPRIGRRLVSVRALAVTVIAAGVMAATYVGTPFIAVAFVGISGWGMVVGLFISPLQTLLQRAAPPEAEGRILALSSTANGIGNTATIPVAGVVAGAIGVQLTGLAVGSLLVAAGVAGLVVATRRPAALPPEPPAGGADQADPALAAPASADRTGPLPPTSVPPAPAPLPTP
jgi:predicted MFS family arabinose efflux permease